MMLIANQVDTVSNSTTTSCNVIGAERKMRSHRLRVAALGRNFDKRQLRRLPRGLLLRRPLIGRLLDLGLLARLARRCEISMEPRSDGTAQCLHGPRTRPAVCQSRHQVELQTL